MASQIVAQDVPENAPGPRSARTGKHRAHRCERLQPNRVCALAASNRVVSVEARNGRSHTRADTTEAG